MTSISSTASVFPPLGPSICPHGPDDPSPSIWTREGVVNLAGEIGGFVEKHGAVPRSRVIDVLANLRICRKMASALGISSIIFGVALVCSGLIMRPRISQTHPAGVDGPIEFRAIIDALTEEEDRRWR